MGLTLFYTVADGDGDPSRIEIPIDDTNFTLAGAADVIEDTWDLLNPLLNGTLISAGFSFEAEIASFTNAAADVLSDVQEKAEFAFRAVTGALKRINLPTFVETFFTGGGKNKDVDTTATAVAAFSLAMRSGLPNAADPDNPIDVVDSHGDSLSTLAYARENWGKRRR